MTTVAASFAIGLPPDRVFSALIDPAILQRSIPGCEELKAIGPDLYQLTLKVGVAGLQGRYKGKAEVRDKRPPESFAIVFDGKGGPGFVRGHAVVTVTAEPSGARARTGAGCCTAARTTRRRRIVR